MNFKLRQLEGFLAAADEGAFSKAADRLAMTQPAFSQLIQELERAVGVRLFDRTTRRVELTEAGRILQAQVRRPLQDLRHAHDSLRELAAGERGSVTFAALPSAAFHIGTRAIARFRSVHPAVQVRQIEDQNGLLVDKVVNREVDFGLGMLAQADPVLRFEQMFDDELVAVLPAGHPLATQAAIAWTDLVEVPLILLPAPSSVRRLAQAGLAMAGSHREPTFEVVNMVTALRMVGEGLGLTILPMMALYSLKMDGLVHRPLGEPRPIRHMGIIRRVDRPPTPATGTLIRFLFEESAKVPHGRPERVSSNRISDDASGIHRTSRLGTLRRKQ
jgi:LysR family carnitine catabolism transcriptional activator